MGWFGKKSEAVEAAAPSVAAEQAAGSKKSCCAEKAEAAQQSAPPPPPPQEAPAAASAPSLPAVFEFGGPAVTGLAMKGICEVDDPDQIQACVWHVDKVPADRSKSTPKFQIAF